MRSRRSDSRRVRTGSMSTTRLSLRTDDSGDAAQVPLDKTPDTKPKTEAKVKLEKDIRKVPSAGNDRIHEKATQKAANKTADRQSRKMKPTAAYDTVGHKKE